MVDIMAEEDFHILDIENLRRHYNKTLLCWDKNFHDHMDEIKKCSMKDLSACGICTWPAVQQRFIRV